MTPAGPVRPMDVLDAARVAGVVSFVWPIPIDRLATWRQVTPCPKTALTDNLAGHWHAGQAVWNAWLRPELTGVEGRALLAWFVAIAIVAPTHPVDLSETWITRGDPWDATAPEGLAFAAELLLPKGLVAAWKAAHPEGSAQMLAQRAGAPTAWAAAQLQRVNRKR